MSFKKQPEGPRDIKITVHSEAHDSYVARRMKGAYEVDINKALKQLKKFLDSRRPDDYRIEVEDE